jgi:hypothetical protein
MMEFINLLLRKKNLFKLIWFLALGSAKNLSFLYNIIYNIIFFLLLYIIFYIIIYYNILYTHAHAREG